MTATSTSQASSLLQVHSDEVAIGFGEPYTLALQDYLVSKIYKISRALRVGAIITHRICNLGRRKQVRST